MLVTAISDLHLGQTFALGQFKAFLEDQRKRVRPAMLVLNGDILELAWMRWSDLCNQKLAMDALDELRAFATGIETCFIPGNHDPFGKLTMGIREFLSPVRVVSPDAGQPPLLELDGVVYTHGNQFDVTTHVWDSILKLPLKRLLPWLYIKMYGTPYQVKTAQRERDYREYIGWIMGRAMMYAIRQGKDLCSVIPTHR